MEPEKYAENGIVEISVKSSLDGSVEPSLYYKAPGQEPRALLVGLHSWSFDRHNQVDNMLPLAVKYGFDLLLPEFRGPNLVSSPRASEACASTLAMQDIIDAAEFVKAESNIMENGVMLAGGSGGGHMAMMMAGYRPEYWRTVAAFVGISDVGRWYYDNPNYSEHMAACCGGKPEGEALLEYRRRSPITYAENIAKARITLYHGKWDPSVPFMHSVRLFNLINERAPESNVFLTVFDGGHDMRIPDLERHIVESLSENTDSNTVTG